MLVISVLALVAAGCGGSSGVKSGQSAVSTSGSGWKEYRPGGGGYSVELPPDWVTVDAASIADGGGLQKFAHDHPEISGALQGFAAIAHAPGTLLGIDRSSAGMALTAHSEFTPNILVRRLDLQTSIGDDAALAQILANGKTTAAAQPGNNTAPQIAHFTMAGTPAGSITYDAQAPRASGGVNAIVEVDSVVVKDGIAYTVFCSSTSADFARVKPVCDHAVASFQVTG